MNLTCLLVSVYIDTLLPAFHLLNNTDFRISISVRRVRHGTKTFASSVIRDQLKKTQMMSLKNKLRK